MDFKVVVFFDSKYVKKSAKITIVTNGKSYTVSQMASFPVTGIISNDLE